MTPTKHTGEEEKSLVEKVERVLNRSTPLDNSFEWREEVARKIVEVSMNHVRKQFKELEMMMVDPNDPHLILVRKVDVLAILTENL